MAKNGRTALLLMLACLAGCQATGNQTRVGEIYSGGFVNVQAGTSSWVYGARARDCGAPAPSYADALFRIRQDRNSDISPDDYDRLSDGGIGTAQSASCRRFVDVRVFDYNAEGLAAGTRKTLRFGRDTVRLSITDQPPIPVSKQKN